MWRLVDHWTDQPPPFEVYGHDAALPAIIIGALEPTLIRHGVPPAAQGQFGAAAVWCSHIQQIQVRGQDIEDPVSGCTDLWVRVDPDRTTISLHIEGIDLLQYLRGEGDASNQPEPLPLAADLDRSLEIVAGLLDSFCSAVIVTPSG